MCNPQGNVGVVVGIRYRARRIDAPGPWSLRSRHGRRFLASLLFFGLALSLSAAGVLAEDSHVLALDEALALASREQPQIAELDLLREAALEAARAERELPDPKLAFAAQNVPATGADAFRFDRDEMTMLSIGVMQDIVRRDKREASSAGMTFEAARLAAEAETARREIRREAAFAWLDAFEAQRRASALRALAAEMAAEHEISSKLLAAGSGSASAVLALDAEVSKLRDELIVAERDEARARAALSRWIGEHALRPFPEHLPHDHSAPAAATKVSDSLIDAHPMVVSAARAMDVARQQAGRARAERRADWGWQLMYGRRQDLPDMVSLQVTVGLPLNRSDRQDRRVAETLARAGAARAQMWDRRRRLAAELAAARADLDASAARLREHEEHMSPAAHARLQTAQASYAGGRGTLLDVWRARRALVEVSLHHDMIIVDRLRATARLQWLLGGEEVAP
ncbi:MAG: TolC family protein [Steroidobacteraceae bacterium]|jgi:outer membrane protein TolC|nr:TolC family protein [Steroidobacteraceae bacterium]